MPRRYWLLWASCLVLTLASCGGGGSSSSDSSGGGGGSAAPNLCPTQSSITINNTQTCPPVLDTVDEVAFLLGGVSYFVDITFTTGSPEHLELQWPVGMPTGSFTCGGAGIECGYGTPAGDLCTPAGGFDVSLAGAIGQRVQGTFAFTLSPFMPSPGNTCTGSVHGSFDLIRGNDAP
jgi:hypothetical protein